MKLEELSGAEEGVLRAYFKSSPIALIRLKAQAVLMRQHGIGKPDIAASLLRDVRTIDRWLKDFAERRMGSIFSGMEKNEHASKLTPSQREQIKTEVGQPPDSYGLPQEFWDVPKLKAYVQAEFGVVYESDVSYHYLLKFSGLSFKYPDKVSPRRQETQIANRMAEVQTEIAPLLQDPHWMVFASDETRLQVDTDLRRAWLVKGKRTLVKTERTQEHQSYLGFLDQKNGHCQVYELEQGKQIYVIPILEHLLHAYPDKNVCVIWDNAACHKGKLLRDSLTKGNALERLHLISLPPYAPDHNPIEHVWQFAKHKLANRGLHPFASIKLAFLDSISQRTFPYHI